LKASSTAASTFSGFRPRARNRVLRHQKPFVPSRALLQQRLEGPPDIALVVEFAPPKPLQRLVVCLHRRVRCLQLEVAHNGQDNSNATTAAARSMHRPSNPPGHPVLCLQTASHL
jgi:hypothetical protein